MAIIAEAVTGLTFTQHLSSTAIGAFIGVVISALQ